jgi:hypothetical protein
VDFKLGHYRISQHLDNQENLEDDMTTSQMDLHSISWKQVQALRIVVRSPAVQALRCNITVFWQGILQRLEKINS